MHSVQRMRMEIKDNENSVIDYVVFSEGILDFVHSFFQLASELWNWIVGHDLCQISELLAKPNLIIRMK